MTEWISAISSAAVAVITALTAWFGLKAFHYQRTSSDVLLALSIFSSINSYWDRIKDNKGETYSYDMGQIFTQFEIASKLFNDTVLSKDALHILKDHIIEVYTAIQSSEDGPKFIESCISSPTTFDELKKFLKQHFPTALLAQKYASDNKIDENFNRT
jgi:hypothetical protein